MELKINRNAVRGPLLQCVRDIIPKRVYCKGTDMHDSPWRDTRGWGTDAHYVYPHSNEHWWLVCTKHLSMYCLNGESEHLPIQLKPFLFTFQHQIRSMSLWWSHTGDDSAPIYSLSLDNTVFVVFSCVALFFTVILFIYIQKRCWFVPICTQKRITNIMYEVTHVEKKRILSNFSNKNTLSNYSTCSL